MTCWVICLWLWGGRGLEGGPKDVQVFELFLTERWRQKYDKVRTPTTPQGEARGGGHDTDQEA